MNSSAELPSQSVPTRATKTQNSKLRLLNVVSILLVLLAFALGGFHFVPQVRYSMIYAMGRSPLCPFDMAIRADEAVHSHYERFYRVTRESRVVERDPAGYWLWETPMGLFWVPAGKDQAFLWLIAEQEDGVYSSGPNALRTGDIVLDCGAHVGVFTREALNAGAKLVVAIEPSPQTLVTLKRNFEKEIAEGRVVIYEKGVWDRDAVLPFYMSPSDAGGDRVSLHHTQGDRIVEVPLTTIDKLVAELNLERVDFIKMDIEGAEQKALAGARGTLAKYKPRLGIAAYHVPDDQTKIPKLVQAANAEYQMKCGVCAERRNRIEALSLQFY